jgi:hypothetical protein
MMQRERFGLYHRRWYDDAKKMTEDQFLSLFQWDHNILHSSENHNRDQFWNLGAVLIREHREKTKVDAKVIAKSKRLRAKYLPDDLTEKGLTEIVKRMPRTKITSDAAGAGNLVARLRPAPLQTEPDEAGGEHFRRPSTPPSSGSKLRSRGFDKRYLKKMDGTVVKRGD